MRWINAVIFFWLALVEGGRRRKDLVRFLDRATPLQVKESTLEFANRRKKWQKQSEEIRIVRPKNMESLTDVYQVTAVNRTHRVSVRAYLASQQEPVRRRRKKQEDSFLNWSSGGFTMVGRIAGVALIPVRGVYELSRLGLVRGLHSALGPFFERPILGLDTILRKGPAKGIPEVCPACDLHRSSRFGRYYHFTQKYTATLRHVLKTSWRTPADIGHYLRSHLGAHYAAHTRRHERLEAALLRAAIHDTSTILADKSFRRRNTSALA